MGDNSTFARWLELPASELVKFGDLAGLMAVALHSDPHAQAAAAVQLEAELKAKVDADILTVRDPLTLGRHTFPIGDALRRAVLLPNLDLRVLLAQHGIELRVIQSEGDELQAFVTEARPLRVPPELLALAPAATVRIRDAFPPYAQGNGYTAIEYREQIEARIARQAEGYFTLCEAAQVLADARSGMKPVEALKRFLLAHSKDQLTIHQAGTRFPLEAGEAISDRRDLLEESELDAWLRKSAGYGFPKAERVSGSAPVSGEATQQGDAAACIKPVSRWHAQEQAILSKLRDLNYSPRALPKSGAWTKGVKSQVRAAIGSNGMWHSSKVFDKAWERLRENGDIADKP